MTKASLTMYANPFLLWFNVAWKFAELMWAAPQVIGIRTRRMASAYPNYSPSDRREIMLMGQEKAEAACESAAAMSTQMLRMGFELNNLGWRQWMATVDGLTTLAADQSMLRYSAQHAKLLRRTAAQSATTLSTLSSSTARLVHRGLKPIHSRATGNARRLRKR